VRVGGHANDRPERQRNDDDKRFQNRREVRL